MKRSVFVAGLVLLGSACGAPTQPTPAPTKGRPVAARAESSPSRAQPSSEAADPAASASGVESSRAAGTDAAEGDTTPPEPPPLIDAREPGVFVTETGPEPKRALALTASLGTARTVPVRMTMRLSVGVADSVVPPTEIPAIRLDVVTKVTAVTPAEMIVEVSTANAAADGEVESDRVRKALVEAVQHLEAARATITIDRKGGVSTMVMAGVADGSRLKPSIDGLFDSLRPMFLTLPTEPLGVGARWEVVSHREEGGAQMQRVVRYELTGAVGDVLAISWQTDRGTVSVGAADGAGIDAHASTGQGVTRYDLASASPVSSSSEIETRTHARVKFGERTSQVMVDLHTQLHVGPHG